MPVISRHMRGFVLSFIKLGIIVIIPAVLVSVLLINRFSESAPDPYATNNYDSPRLEKEDEKLKVETSFENEALDNAIKQIISSYPEFETGISVHNLSNGAVYNYGDSEAYYAASTTKLISIADFLSKTESGEYSLSTVFGDTTADSQFKKMVHNSNNIAWDQLRKFLSHQDINAFAWKVGMPSFNSSENLVSSADMAVFLAKLYKGEMLNAQNTQYLLGLMAAGDQNYPINFGLPAGAKDYHKNGWLADRLNLALIVENGEQKFALTVFSNTASGGAYNFTAGKKMIKQTVQAVIDNLK